MVLAQGIIVAALVAASLILSAWWLMPVRQRLWVLDHLMSAGATHGPLARLRRTLLARSQVGCQACAANPSASAPGSTEKSGALRR
jgi:hypothetical protein